MNFTPPGLLRPEAHPDVVMMIGTAGHVDHGKTKLVKLLTGCETDRLKEEQARGMTIELGFAPCFLGGDACLGIVDVPGHERFIHTMVAGVSGLDMTILVIAADDGVMPQTVEHLQIMELLGVRHGLVALTKTDLVSPDTVARRVVELRAFLQGSFLEDAPICPVSSETFEGYDAFYTALVDATRRLQRRHRAGVFRMPVERTFSQQGFGAIVSGIPTAGRVRVGEAVELVPGHHTGRVRGIQCFLRDAPEGGYGQCLALNIPDFGKAAPARGQVVGTPGYLRAAAILHARLHTVPRLHPPLRHAEEVKFHTGTAETAGHVFLLEEKTLGASASALATIVVREPVVVVPGDRFIVRRPSPAATVAGGEVLEVCFESVRPRRREIVAALQAREAFFAGVDPASEDGADRQVEYVLRGDGRGVAGGADLAHRALLLPEALTRALARLQAEGRVLALDADTFVHADVYAARRDETAAQIARACEAGALKLTATDLRAGHNWPLALWNRILADLEQRGVASVRGNTVLPAAAAATLSEADRGLVERLQELYARTGFHSPLPEEAPLLLKADPDRVRRFVDYLCDRMELVRVSPKVVLSRAHFRRAQDLAVTAIRDRGALESADFKGLIDSTRKYAVAILEFLDARRVTVRAGNVRKLLSGYEKNLL